MMASAWTPRTLIRFIFREFHKSRQRYSQELQQKLELEIMERRQIEKELAHLASFPEWDPNCVIEADLSGNFKYINPAGQREFPELATLKLRHPLMEGLDTLMDQLRHKKETIAKRALKLGDKVYEQQVTVFEEYACVRVYMLDITERKKIDQLKSDFVNTVSHELRTPLTAVQATVKMVFGGMLGDLLPDQKEALSLALLNVDRLGRMIDDLLDLSKIEAGKFELHREWVDAASLIDTLGRSFQALAQQKGLTIRFRVSPKPLKIFIDRDKITQVITNLVSNAMKFTEKGWISLSVGEGENGVQFEIADTGRGIAPENLSKVFQKFQQFGPRPLHGEKGTGLGLSLCKALVELHRGAIRVESTLGKGTQFIFTLPCLNDTDLFKENVQNCLGLAANEGKSLSLLQFSVRNGRPLSLPGDPVSDLLVRFESIAKEILRTDSDTMVKTPSAVWVLLPDVDKISAGKVVERIRQAFGKGIENQEVKEQEDVCCKIASYPEDENLVEKLLSLIV